MFCFLVWTFAMSGWHRRIVVPLGSPLPCLFPPWETIPWSEKCAYCAGYVGKCLKTLEIWIKHWNLFGNMPGMDEKYNSLLSFLDLGKHQNYGEFWSERLSFGSDIEARWSWNKTKLDEDVKLEQSLVARDHYSGQQETFPRWPTWKKWDRAIVNASPPLQNGYFSTKKMFGLKP